VSQREYPGLASVPGSVAETLPLMVRPISGSFLPPALIVTLEHQHSKKGYQADGQKHGGDQANNKTENAYPISLPGELVSLVLYR
jgi:hypothetical protein